MNREKQDLIAFSEQIHKLMNYCHNITANIPLEIVKQLSDTELMVIRLISNNSKIKICDIASTQHISKSTLTNIIRRLEKQGYLIRKINTSDLRSFELILTKKGITAQKEHIQFEKIFFSKLLNPLNENEKEDLFKLMKKMTRGSIKNE